MKRCIRRAAGRRAGLASILPLLVLPGLTGFARAEPETGLLRAALWEARVAGEEAGGSACWLAGRSGELRVDVARHPTADAADALPWGRLLGRAGQGWTVVSGPDGAVAGRWGAPLETPDEGLLLRLRILVSLLDAGPDPAAPALPPEARLRRPAGPAGAPRLQDRGRAAAASAEIRVRLPETGPLRQRMEARGRGRGGTGETWRAGWRSPEGESVSWLTIRSSRIPGVLRARPLSGRTVEYEPADVFVPLWALGDLLGFPDERPVSGPPQGGTGPG